MGVPAPGTARRHLTPVGLAWTLGFYLLLGLGTAEALRQILLLGSPAGPVLLVLLASTAWMAARVCSDGQLVRGAAWLAGIGATAVHHVLTEAPICGNLVFGAGLPGVSPGVAPCSPHQDFMVLVFVTGWALLGPVAAVALSAADLRRWARRDPLHAYRLLMD